MGLGKRNRGLGGARPSRNPKVRVYAVCTRCLAEVERGSDAACAEALARHEARCGRWGLKQWGALVLAAVASVMWLWMLAAL